VTAPDLLASRQRAIEHAFRVLILLVGLMAILTGAASASAALAADASRFVNAYAAVMVLLGPQTLLLMAWLILRLTWGRLGSPGLLLVGVLSLLRRAARKHAGDAGESWRVWSDRFRGAEASLASALTHGFWFVASMAMLVCLIGLLSAFNYDFGWETTILSAQEYERVSRLLGRVTGLIGLPGPDESIVSASQKGTGPFTHEGNAAWARMIIGAVLMLGAVPRGALLLHAVVRVRSAVRRAKRADLASSVPAASASLGARMISVEAPAPAAELSASSSPTGAAPRAALGFELGADDGWPVRMPGIEALGQSHEADDLLSMTPRGAPILLVLSLNALPDRGMRRVLERVRERSGAAPWLLLTGGHAARERGWDVAQRAAQWRELGLSVIDHDLAHETPASRRRLSAFLGLKESAGQDVPNVGRWREALALIRGEAESAHPAPARGELETRVTALYRDRATTASFAAPIAAAVRAAKSAEDFAAPMRQAASEALRLFPASLRRDPRWIAAGALAGALGCVAAGALISPVAIGALPIWAMLGGSTAWLLTSGSSSSDAPVTGAEDDVTVWASAVTLTLLLELQGRSEAEISRRLDLILSPHPLPAHRSGVGAWIGAIESQALGELRGGAA